MGCYFRLQRGELIYTPAKLSGGFDPEEAGDIDWGRIDEIDRARDQAVKDILIDIAKRGIVM